MTITTAFVTRPEGYLVDPRALTPVHTGFISHLETYPTYVSSKNAFYALPLTKRTVNLVRGPVLYVRNTNPVKFFMDHTCAFADGALDQVDKFVPGLKTLEFRDVLRPLRGRATQSHGDATAQAPRKRFLWRIRGPKPAATVNARSTGVSTGRRADGCEKAQQTRQSCSNRNHDGDNNDPGNNGCAVAAFVDRVWTRNGEHRDDGVVHVTSGAPVSAVEEAHATRALA